MVAAAAAAAVAVAAAAAMIINLLLPLFILAFLFFLFVTTYFDSKLLSLESSCFLLFYDLFGPADFVTIKS